MPLRLGAPLRRRPARAGGAGRRRPEADECAAPAARQASSRCAAARAGAHARAHRICPETMESTGVIAMVDLLIKDDLDKEMTEAETQEKNNQEEYEKLMKEGLLGGAGHEHEDAGRQGREQGELGGRPAGQEGRAQVCLQGADGHGEVHHVPALRVRLAHTVSICAAARRPARTRSTA
ncbi:unnamed protein product [Prorocentrum cordatum]|uniref:Uncharacterized protein n=1 Tax=Prorocentrum cordatum TaxID=2364126 RepID=A0ABN9Y4K2_9DINO|nr:unnamed protein product [Polarella glacialis]